MLIRFVGLMALMMIPVGVFFYFYFRRTILFWSHRDKSRIVRVVSVLLAVLAALGSLNPFSVTALVILHVAAAQVIVQLLWLAGKRFIKSPADSGDTQLSDSPAEHPVERPLSENLTEKPLSENPTEKPLHKSPTNKTLPEKIYRCGLVPLVVTALVLGYGYLHMKDVEPKNYTVSINKELPDGLTVALISDLHFGTTMDREKLQRYCDEISAQNPDIIALCGDIVDERTTAEEMRQAIQTLGGMESKYGIYYVFGNHDSADPPFTVPELTEAFEAAGIRMLTDECVELGDNIVLAGRLDRSYSMSMWRGDASHEGVESIGRKDTKKLLEGVDRDKFILLLDHQPVELEENAAAGVDLQLSGHTHGGQIWPVGLISDWLGFGELNYGEKTMGDYHVIVSSGIAGWGYPIRTGSNSEYLIVKVSGTNRAAGDRESGGEI